MLACLADQNKTHAKQVVEKFLELLHWERITDLWSFFELQKESVIKSWPAAISLLLEYTERVRIHVQRSLRVSVVSLPYQQTCL